MKTRSNSFLIGLYLIFVGALFLLSTLGLIRYQDEFAVAILFFAAGLVLLFAHFVFKKPLWTMIVGISAAFVGLAIAISESRIIPEDYIGIIFFVLTALVFLNGLRAGKKNWWVIIPGGYCLVFAGHILLERLVWHADEYHGVLFFLGSALIFGTLYLIKNKQYNLQWAKYPSLISFIMAGIIMLTVDFSDLFSRFFFPAILILIGAYVIYHSFTKKSETAQVEQKEEIKTALPPEKVAKKTQPKKRKTTR